ncbi:MFS transporter [Limnohabitans sp. Rim8]|uniref:MFS transporter n=1 Tax=Limnohabitans sp. Rim8 TaxID=1100718 RepID=UPI0025D98B67|nr:MFS transporter [Limnohabitans sp. Rim8]
MFSPSPSHTDKPVARLPWLGFAVVGCGASIAPLDFAVNMAFPAMTEAFALATADIRWVAVCYVVTYGGLMLFCGVLGDRLGHLRVFRWGLVLSALGLAACAAAPAYGWLLAGRVVQGVGVALTLSCAPALAMGLLAAGQRTQALSVYGAMFAGAGLLAPMLGGLSILIWGWAGVYGFRVPIVLLAWLCTPWLARRLRAQTLSVPGDVSQAGSVRGVWDLMRRDADFAWINLVNVGVQFCSFTIALSLPYALPAAGWGGTATGAMLALWLLGVLVGSGAAPALLRRMSLRAADHGAQGVMALGLAWIGAVSMAQAWPFMALALVVQGVGLGVFQVVYADQVVARLPDSARGLSGSLTLVTRTVGIVAAAMVWLWLMQWLQTQALAQGDSTPQAIWVGTMGLTLWASGVAWVLVGLSVWRQRRRAG